MKCLVAILFIIATCHGANILGIFHHPGKSHHKLGEVLLKGLAKKGHHVTMVSPYPLKEKFPNYVDIDTHEMIEEMNERIENQWFQRFSKNSAGLNTFLMLLNMTTTHADLLFENQEFMNLVKTKQKFDLIIMDWLFNESHLVFGHIFNCPIIPIASAGTSLHVNYLVGNPAPWSYVPYKYFPLTDNMNFVERLTNVAANVGIYYFVYFQQSDHQQIINKYFPDAPTISELVDYVAIVFSNTHFSYETARPYVPNLIEVGGFHVEETKPLEKDLKAYLDDAKDGFIYFSLGTNMKSIFLDGNKRDSILKALGKIPLNIVWKFEGHIENVPKNVRIGKWFPQNDVLAHPNIKLFITHGGLLSTIESIYHGVPMIGIPMFGDQNSNVPIGVENGYALQIKPDELSEDILVNSIMAMLKNPRYKQVAILHSKLLRNQPIKPLDKAIYWVEHVLKHKGAKHLRNASTALYWYQNMLIDVIAFLLAILFIIYFVTKFIICKTMRLLKRLVKRNKKVDNKKKKQ